MTNFEEEQRIADAEAMTAALTAWERMTKNERSMVRIGLLPAWINTPEFKALCADGRAVAVAVFKICNTTSAPMVV